MFDKTKDTSKQQPVYGRTFLGFVVFLDRADWPLRPVNPKGLLPRIRAQYFIIFS